MDYGQPLHKKAYKPSPDYLYFHPGYRNSEGEKWSCCNQRTSYISQRGCRKVFSFWKSRKHLLFYYLNKSKDTKSPLSKLPESLVKDIIFYL